MSEHTLDSRFKQMRFGQQTYYQKSFFRKIVEIAWVHQHMFLLKQVKNQFVLRTRPQQTNNSVPPSFDRKENRLRVRAHNFREASMILSYPRRELLRDFLSPIQEMTQ